MKQENTSENSHSDHFSPSIPLEETSLNQSFNMEQKNKKTIHFEVEKEQFIPEKKNKIIKQKLNTEKKTYSQEENMIIMAMKIYKGSVIFSLNYISKLFNITIKQAQKMFKKLISKELKYINKKPFNEYEDQLLKEYAKSNNNEIKSYVILYVPGKTPKQSREHYFNKLKPNILIGNWTTKDDFMIFYYYKRFEGSWIKYKPLFPNRSLNSIKNRFFSILRLVYMKNEQIKKTFRIYPEKLKLVELLKYFDNTLESYKEQMKNEVPNYEELLEENEKILKENIIPEKKIKKKYLNIKREKEKNEKKENKILFNVSTKLIEEKKKNEKLLETKEKPKLPSIPPEMKINPLITNQLIMQNANCQLNFYLYKMLYLQKMKEIECSKLFNINSVNS